MTIEIEGGNSLRRSFYGMAGVEGGARLKEAYGEIATRAAVDSQAAARSGSPFQQKMAGAIKPRPTTQNAGIAITRTGEFKAAGVAFWGVNRRLGWFADPKFGGYTQKDQKLPDWVGNAWTAATVGQGPHRINEAMAARVPFYMDVLDRALE